MRESRLVYILKFLILMAVELNVLTRIDIGESMFLSGGSCLTAYKDELILRGNCLIWMMIRLEDRDLSQPILSLLLITQPV